MREEEIERMIAGEAVMKEGDQDSRIAAVLRFAMTNVPPDEQAAFVRGGACCSREMPELFGMIADVIIRAQYRLLN